MKRFILTYLLTWLARNQRQPLVLRGARQVGKTWIVRELAKQANRQLIEINFERQMEQISLFESNDPKQILLEVGSAYHTKIDPKMSLLFLDEIQAAPALLAKLRWFAEELPELPVIAAGSLLEFVLSDHSFSMPVGRIGYVHMEPLSFEEFLMANGAEILVEYLRSYSIHATLPLALHQQLSNYFKEYLFIGGMPAAVNQWVRNKDIMLVNETHHNIVATFRDDFSKYSGRVDVARLNEVFSATPELLSQPFKYSMVNKDVSTHSIKNALSLLIKARVCHKIKCTHANGLPIGAQLDEKRFKVIFMDVGLCAVALGFTYDQLMNLSELDLVNKGGLSEQVVGQLLRALPPPYVEPALYYWQRNKPDATAEIDYIIAHGHKLIPIEVKAGTTGTLKSLHYFMEVKKLGVAVRINAGTPNVTPVDIKSPNNENIQYQLLSIPFYLIGQLQRLLQEVV